MRWRSRVDLLTGQHVQFRDRVLEPMEVREVGMEVECGHPVEELQPIQPIVDFDRRRRTIQLGSGSESKSVANRYTEPREQRASEAAKTLPRRNGLVAVVKELRLLTVLAIWSREFFDL